MAAIQLLWAIFTHIYHKRQHIINLWDNSNQLKDYYWDPRKHPAWQFVGAYLWPTYFSFCMLGTVLGRIMNMLIESIPLWNVICYPFHFNTGWYLLHFCNPTGMERINSFNIHEAHTAIKRFNIFTVVLVNVQKVSY